MNMETTRTKTEPPPPVRVRCLVDGIQDGLHVCAAGDTIEVTEARAREYLKRRMVAYADGRPTPTPEEQAYQTAVEAYGPLPATDPRLMARQIAALQADVAELREAIATLTAPASRPKSK